MAKSIRTILSVDYPHIHIVGSEPLKNRPFSRYWTSTSPFFLGISSVMALTTTLMVGREALLYFQNPAAYSPLEMGAGVVAVGIFAHSLRPFFRQLNKARMSPLNIEKRQRLLEACDQGDLQTLKDSNMTQWDWVGYPNGLQELKSNTQPSSPILMALRNRHMHVLAWMAEQGTDILALTEKHQKHLKKPVENLKKYLLREIMEDGKNEWASTILQLPSLNAQQRLDCILIREEEITRIDSGSDSNQDKFNHIRDLFNACYPRFIQHQDLEQYIQTYPKSENFVSQLCQEALVNHQKQVLSTQLPLAQQISNSSKSRI